MISSTHSSTLSRQSLNNEGSTDSFCIPKLLSLSPEHSDNVTNSNSPAPSPTAPNFPSTVKPFQQSPTLLNTQGISSHRFKSSQQARRSRHRHPPPLTPAPANSTPLSQTRSRQRRLSSFSMSAHSDSTSSQFSFTSFFQRKASKESMSAFTRSLRTIFIFGCVMLCIVLFYRQMHILSLDSRASVSPAAQTSATVPAGESESTASALLPAVVTKNERGRGGGGAASVLGRALKPAKSVPRAAPIDIQRSLLNSDFNNSLSSSTSLSSSYANSPSTLTSSSAPSLGGIYSANLNKVSTTSRSVRQVSVQHAIATLYTASKRFRLQILLHSSGHLGYSLEFCYPPGEGCEAWNAVLLPTFVKLKVAEKLMVFHVANRESTLRVHEYSGGSLWSYNRTARMDRYHLPSEYEVMSRQYVGVHISCHVKDSCSNTLDWTIDFRLFDDAVAVRALLYFKPAAFSALAPHSSASDDFSQHYIPVELHLSVRTINRKNSQWCFSSVAAGAMNRTLCESMRGSESQSPFTVRFRWQSEEIERSKRSGLNVFTIAQAAGWSYTQSTVRINTPAEQANLRFDDATAANPNAKEPAQTSLIAPNRGGLPEVFVSTVARGEAALAPQIGLDNLDAELSSDLGDADGNAEHAVVASSTSWHVILFGMKESDLYAANVIIPLLCPPPSEHLATVYNDLSWLGRGGGKAFWIEREATMRDGKGWVNFARAHRAQFIELHEGWYGEQTNLLAALTATHRKDESQDKLDVAELVQYGKSQGIGVSVYFSQHALSSAPLNQLLSVLGKLAVHGVKMSDVDVSQPALVRLLHQQIIAIAKSKLFVTIQHNYRPRGYSRTFPHLLTQEGLRNEQYHPDAAHHVILLFNRGMIGSMDYAPTYARLSAEPVEFSVTHAHQLALPIALFGVIQSMFVGADRSAIQDAYNKYPELVHIWDSIPTVWDDSLLLAGDIPDYALVARYSHEGHRWLVAMIAGLNEVNFRVSLSPLFNAVRLTYFPANTFGFLFTLYRDADNWPYIRASETLITRDAPCWISMRSVLAALNGTKLSAEEAEQDHGRVTKEGQPLEQCIFELHKYPVLLAKSGGALLKIDAILL